MRYIITETYFFVFLCFIFSPILAGNTEASSATLYTCGHVSFTDVQIKSALDEINVAIEKRKMNRFLYHGELYRSNRGYHLWPITRKGKLVGHKEIHNDPFFILTQRNSQKVHVMAMTYDKKFANCMKTKGSSSSNLVSVAKKSNGYQCGDYFFSDQFLRTTVIIANRRPSDHPSSRNGYPIAYNGLLFNDQIGLQLWPITRQGFVYKKVSPKPSTYFVLINGDGQLVDVIIKMADLKYIRCLRANKHLPDPLFTSTGDPRPSSPYSGYLCDKTFFDDTSLRHHAEIFKSDAFNPKNIFLKFDKLEHPFNVIGIYSLLDFGFVVPGPPVNQYFALLDLDFNIVKVGIQDDKNRISFCKRYDSEAKNHDQRNYKCSSIYYKNSVFLHYIRYFWQNNQIQDPRSLKSKNRHGVSLSSTRNNLKIIIKQIPKSDGSSENHYIEINQKYELLGVYKETNGKSEKCEALSV